MRTLFLALTCLALMPSAYADSVVQFAGDSTCKGRNSKDVLVDGVDVPAGAKWAKFNVVDGDENVSNYSIDDAGRLLYKGALIADAAGFKRALNADPNIPDLAKVQLTPYLILIDSYTADPDGTKAAWARVKKVLNLDPTIAGGIEAYAAAYGMPLEGL